jgi:hypothetical protein
VRQLVSKLAAGGLSAAVILLWYPLVFPSDTIESWMIRGVLWTLMFELLLVAFTPVEEALWRSRAIARVRDQAMAAAGARLGEATRRRRIGARTLAASVALAAPIGLIASAPAHELAPVKTEHVRYVTKVERIVKVERRRVAVPVPVPTPGPTVAAPAVHDAGTLDRSVAPDANVKAPARSSSPGARTTSEAPVQTAPAPATAAPPASAGTPAATHQQAVRPPAATTTATAPTPATAQP